MLISPILFLGPYYYHYYYHYYYYHYYYHYYREEVFTLQVRCVEMERSVRSDATKEEATRIGMVYMDKNEVEYLR